MIRLILAVAAAAVVTVIVLVMGWVPAIGCENFDRIAKIEQRKGNALELLSASDLAVYAGRYNVAGARRGFRVQRGPETLLGIEVGKCIIPPIDITGVPVRLSGRYPFGTFA